MSEDIIFLHANKIDAWVDIPNAFGELRTCKIIWIRPLSDGVFEASLMTKEGGYTIWLLKLLEGGKFEPLSCGLYFTEKEITAIRLSDKLNLDGQAIRQNIYKQRIADYARQ